MFWKILPPPSSGSVEACRIRNRQARILCFLTSSRQFLQLT